MSLAGMRVLALESRRSTEMATLIRNQQGEPFAAPSMREIPLEQNEEAFRFATRLLAGEFDMTIFLTGVGTRALARVIASRHPAEALPGALRKTVVVASGPKPVAALREMQVPVTVQVPEPNTWRELLVAIHDRPEKHVAVQEYGKPNPELLAALRARGGEVTPVPVYQWGLPEDTGPLREAVERLVNGRVDVALFTTSIQVTHLFRMAAEAGIEESMRESLRRIVVASIGPSTSETLEEYGIQPDLEPSHPKMGFLVREAAEKAPGILKAKRA